MPKSMPSEHENVTDPGHTEVNAPSPEIAALADLLAALPDSDRAVIIGELNQDQRLAIARLLAVRIMEGPK